MRGLKFILECAFWLVAAGTLIFAAALFMGAGMAPVLAVVGMVAVLVLIPVSLRLSSRTRRQRASMILTYLEQAVRLNLPLPKMLWAAQQSEKGASSLRLAQLRQTLEGGVPVGAALETSAPEVPDRSVALIAAAERVGRLPHALAMLREEQRARNQTESMSIAFYRVYPGIMLMMVALTIWMLSVFVMPKLLSIFRDFRIQMPPITVRTYQTAYTVAPIVFLLVAAWLLWLAGSAMWQTFHPERKKENPLRNAMDHVLWWLPLAGTMQRDRGLADVLELVAEALEAGMPADQAIVQGATLRLNAVLKDRTYRWAEGVAGGASIHVAARQAWLPSLVWGMLSTATQENDAVNALRFLARYYRSRFARTAAFVQAATVPLIVMIFGVIVGFVAMSLFVPLVKIIDATGRNVKLGL
ncbi:MAG TPA: type II secretion system F family protein [Tepidisphaeraceae bacterium]|jgi:type II secretory pathway component PulF